MGFKDAPEIEIRSRAELRAWLEANHAAGEPVWVIAFKKHHEHYLPYGALVEEVLCFGWIDSLRRSLDADRYQQYIAPRKPGSNWSGLNKRRVHELEAAGLMTDAGRAKIREAQADGSWTILDEVEQVVTPPDLALLFDAYPGTRAAFEAYPRSARMGFLWWIKSAKTEGTRRKRLEGTIQAVQQGVRVPGQAAGP
jgi:uncharacterized protein YdeI (YjbR/CyaY-like superfamily)